MMTFQRFLGLAGCGLLTLALVGCDRADQTNSPPAAATQPAAANGDGEMSNLRALAQQAKQPAGGGEDAALPPGHPPLPPPSQPELPPGHPPLDPNAQMPNAGQAQNVAPLKYEAPQTWSAVQPSGTMRVDQYQLPAPTAEGEPGEMAVFYFGVGGAGGIDANVQRWRGQFTTAEGEPVPDEAFERKVEEINGFKVTLVNVSGRYDPGMAMGGTGPKENYAMLGAIVETPNGPWFFKGVGPQETMEHNRDAFREFLQTMRIE